MDANLDLRLDLACDPASVQGWWLDFPEDYRARDPKEQPHRIRTLRRTEDAIEVDTFWPGPFGRPTVARETLRIDAPGRWRAEVDMMGMDIRDEFTAEASGGGTSLRIRSSIRPRTLPARLAFPLVRPVLLRAMRRTWTDAARICEREACGTSPSR